MKKIWAVLLVITLMFASLYPMQNVNAAATTTQNEGLSLRDVGWGQYYANKALSQLPTTIEATFRLAKSTSMYRAGIILGNGKNENTSSTESGTFNFGFYKGMIPYLYVTDANNKKGNFYLFGEYECPSGNLKTGSDFTVDSAQTAAMRAKFCTNEWVHMTLVNDVAENEMRLYVNGELFWTLEETSYSGTFTMSNPLVVGGDRRLYINQAFYGDIKNVALYKDVRTEMEVKSDYTSGVDGAEEDLLAAYTLGLTSDGNYPRTIEDLSGNGYTLQRYFISEAEKEASTPRQEYDYSMAVVGDPQIVTARSVTSSKDKGKIDALYKWIVDNAKDRNIKFAFTLGDFVHDPNNVEQYEAAVTALKQLNGVVPYSIIRGNHDKLSYYNTYFKYDDFKGQLEGSFDATMLNTYQKFQVGNIKYMVVNLDFGVGGADTADSDEIIAWANKIVAANPDYNVIVTTHGYLYNDGTRLGPGRTSSPTYNVVNDYGYQRDKDGTDIWNEFTSKHSNIVLVLSGHITSEKIVKSESIGVNGNTVVEMLVNPQGFDETRDLCGMVAMLYFSNGGKTVQVEYYSTLRDKYYKEDSQFTFNLNVIESDVIEGENGAVILNRDNVNTEGQVPVPVYEDYKDYVFAGWYQSANAIYDNAITDLSEVTESSYAKFIPKDILDVKVQVSNGTMKTGTYKGQHAMRFISSVESLDYKNVGFKVTYIDENGQVQTKSISSKTVYEKIKSNIEEVNYNFTPSVITMNSEYFITAKLPITDTEKYYTVQAYVQTADGTIVYGDSRCICVNDASEKIINTTVDVELDGQKSYVVTYGTNTGTITLLNEEEGYSNIKIEWEEDVTAILPSASTITIYEVTDSGNQLVDSFVYRNYYTTHETGDAANPNADTSWYTINPYADIFTIASSADLYGLAKLIDDGTTNFTGREIRLIRDVVVNKGEAIPATSTADATWKADDGELVYEWEPIGKNWNSGVNYFDGTFDGEGNSVSGIFLDSTTYVGFFATAGQNSIIKNFAVTNIYIRGTQNYVGSIVAFARSQYLENLYSDAVVVHENSASTIYMAAGGIVGRYGNTATSGTGVTILRSVKNCWFDGNICANGNVIHIGGIIGDFLNAHNIEFTNCFYTGNTVYNYTGASVAVITTDGKIPSVGGLYGHAQNAAADRVQKYSNCIVAGELEVTYPTGCTSYAGTFVGRPSAKKGGTTIANCYSVCNFTVNGTESTKNYGVLHYQTQWVDCTTTKDKLMINSEETLTTTWLPMLANEEESAWMCYTDGNGNALGTPILKSYSDLWLDKQ